MSDSRRIAVKGTVDGGGGTVSVAPNGLPVVGVRISGTFVQTLVIEELIDGTDPTAAQVFTAAGVAASATVTAPGRFFVAASGRSTIQVRQTAYTSGTATIVLNATSGSIGSSGGGGGGGAVTVADGADVTQGAIADVAVQGDNAGTVSAKLRGLNKSVAAGVPITAAALPLPAGAAADATVAGVTTAVGTLITQSDFDTKVGSLTETAPASDTASSGLNGRLQRVAQRLTSLIGLLPAALVNGALVLTGDTAHGVTDAGNPVEIGFGALAHGTNPAPVAAGQRTRGTANRAGVPFIIGGHPNPITAAANFTTAQTNQPLVAGSAGSKIVVTGFMVTASNANTANVSAVLGLAASVTPTAGQVVGAHPGIAPGSGFGRGAGAGILGVGADTDALLLTSSAPTGGSIWVVWQYYTVPS